MRHQVIRIQFLVLLLLMPAGGRHFQNIMFQLSMRAAMIVPLELQAQPLTST